MLAAMLELHVYAGGFGLISMSPYCIHVEARLRFAGIAYARALGLQHQAPQKVLPWAKDGDALLANPRELGARVSELTGQRLEGAARATHALVDECLYWAFVYSRWFAASTIIGATSAAQLAENLGALAVQLPSSVLAEIDDIHLRYTNPAP